MNLGYQALEYFLSTPILSSKLNNYNELNFNKFIEVL